MVVSEVVPPLRTGERCVRVLDRVGVTDLFPVNAGRRAKSGNLQVQRTTLVCAGLRDGLILNRVRSWNRFLDQIEELHLEDAVIRAGRGKVNVLPFAEDKLCLAAPVTPQISAVLLCCIACQSRVVVKGVAQIAQLVSFRLVEARHHLCQIGTACSCLVRTGLNTVGAIDLVSHVGTLEGRTSNRSPSLCTSHNFLNGTGAGALCLFLGLCCRTWICNDLGVPYRWLGRIDPRTTDLGGFAISASQELGRATVDERIARGVINSPILHCSLTLLSGGVKVRESLRVCSK